MGWSQRYRKIIILGGADILMVKFGFFEKATKFEKNLRRTFDKSIVRVLCAQQRTCQKVDEDF